MVNTSNTTGRRVGIDIGGTFTDLFVVEGDGQGRIYKSPTTPHDPSVGLLNGLTKAADAVGESLEEFLSGVSAIVHGTTIATNAVLTRQGAKTGFVTTRGFRDLLNMRRGIRDRQNDSKYAPPVPLVPRDLVATVRERIDVLGNELVTLNEDDVRAAAQLFRDQGVDAVAISYLWSFLDPAHEQRTAEILREELPDAFVTISSDVLPQIRAYERHSTTVLNAFVGPKLQKYLANIKRQLADRGFGGTLLIVQSNGGVMSPEIASEMAVNALMSGPAAAPEAALQYARRHGSEDVITVDMGGTSFDVALVRDGKPLLTSDSEIGGYRVALPMLDIHTVGAGGGSLVWVDSGGILRVGPQSATATPGPACYGRGGQNPTTTDAELLMGYLNPDLFGDGAFTLDVDAARKAVEEKVAEPLGLSVTEAVEGIYRVVNATMAEAVNAVSVKRGVDPREFTLVVAGGAGPIHAVPIAQELGISRIIVPRESSVFCAVGTLLTDLKHMYARTFVSDMDSLDLSRVSAVYREMRDEAIVTLRSENVDPDAIDLIFTADVRYVGQFDEIEVPLEFDGELTPAALKQLVADFEEKHESLNGYSMPGEATELINVRLTAFGRTTKPALAEDPSAGQDPSAAHKGTREAIFSGSEIQVDVYDGLELRRDNRVFGPAVIEQPTTTVVLIEGYTLTVDAQGTYVIEPARAAD
ncbi:hydantoinase/oxoprolinase family protein [Skermania sp. ID1734]|uniref:hydantoinase/oxoprolinase family protein n=1 Tax=Skermania sp. ID1734 TaxID=2597516 RepID=UPI00117FAF6B|nr:hydantoinase/oxoprolinase family protein [Skermania sp. ID1734]TSD98072.1 hydantoinase/oxoprolinase family protein [Skermania sp. ID1734]